MSAQAYGQRKEGKEMKRGDVVFFKGKYWQVVGKFSQATSHECDHCRAFRTTFYELRENVDYMPDGIDICSKCASKVR